MIVATATLASLVAGCGQSAVSASEARQEVHDYAAAAPEWDPPDEEFFLTMVDALQPDWDVPAETVIGRAYFACHDVGKGREVTVHWVEATQGAGWTGAQARDVLSAGVASLCPWQMARLESFTSD